MRRAILILAASLACATSAAAQNPYPLVFDQVNDLKRYGLALVGIGQSDISAHFPTRCYYYGDGGWDISISDDLLAFYKAQGFSRRSACLALVSGIRFNPESGQRLATYILVDRSLLKPQDNEPGAASDELPLSLPNCFRGGLPYSDCAWNYDPMTGKKLAANATIEDHDKWEACRGDPTTRKFCDKPWAAKQAGARIEGFLSDPKNRCASREVKSSDPDEALIQGTISDQCQFVAGEDDSEATIIAWNTSATLYDHAAEFPKGYGYALNADGGAGREVSADAVTAALHAKKPPAPIDASHLKEIWAAGTQ